MFAKLFFPFAVLLTASPSAQAQCLSSDHSWKNASFPVQSAAFDVSFDAIPIEAKIDGVAGLSSGSASRFKNLAAIVRFNHLGYIDARNGGDYAAGASVPYAAGSTYHFRLVIDPAAHNYSVYVTPPGASEIALATNYAFRSEQSSVKSLNNWSLYADAGSIQVCGFALGAGHPAPSRRPS
jgi:hypothetical protein